MAYPFPGMREYVRNHPRRTMVLGCYVLVALLTAGGCRCSKNETEGLGLSDNADKFPPITASFDKDKFTTTYTVSTPKEHGDFDLTQAKWEGPNCGTWETGKQDEFVSIFVWHHPHPPCAQTTNHSEVTIKFTVPTTFQHSFTQCAYQGSESGRGPECKSIVI